MPNKTPISPAPIEIIMSKLLETVYELPGVPIPQHTDKSLNTLVSSILVKGVQVPILARIREDGACEIIDGYRRFRASQLAKRKEIPVNLIKATPEQARSLFYKLHGLPEPNKQASVTEKDAKQDPSAAEKKPLQDGAEKPDEAKDPEAKKNAPAPSKSDDKKAAPADKADAEKKTAPAEKTGEAAKPSEAKPAPEAKDAKPDPTRAKKDASASEKPSDKTPPAADPKKEPPATDQKKAPPATEKPEEKKPEAKRADTPAKPAEKKAAAPTTDKPSEKPMQAAPADKDKVAAKPAAYAEGPTGTTITKVLGEKLNPPDDKALADLPLPKEGEAFAVVLHPGYLKKADFNHFSVDRDSDDFKELFKSIQMFGVKDPVLARPGKDGTLEILSGQRRHLIAAELNYPVPTIIQRTDDDDARILVADGNLHREKISTYDQSRALRMKMDSMKHKAGRRKKGEIASGKTDEALAAEMGISIAKLRRLMRLSDANREVCNMIDDGKLTLSVASAISQLKPANQSRLTSLIDINLKPSADQVERMRKAEAAGKLTEKAMRDIIDNKDIAPKAKPAPAPVTTSAAPAPAPSAPTTPSMAPPASSIPKSPDVSAPGAPTPTSTPAEPAPNVVPFSTVAAHNNAEGSTPAKPAEADPFVGKQERPESTKVILSGDRLRKYFPDVNMTPREIEDKVYEAIDFYQKYQEKQKQKAAIFDKGKGGSAR